MLPKKIEPAIRKILAAHPTPFYCYDLQSIRERAALVRSRLGANIDIFYSAKANSHPRILAEMKAVGLMADVASMGELERAERSGFPAHAISFTGPGKQSQEIERAVSSGIGAIVVESEHELELIESIAKGLGKRAAISVRLSPARRIGFTGRLLVDEPTQFGIDEASLDSFIIALHRTQYIDVIGTHSHVQSQILKSEHVISNFEFAIEASHLFQLKLSAQKKSSTKRLESFRVVLGGGIGIPYSMNSEPFDIDRFGVQLQQLASKYSSTGPLGQPLKFGIELGRYLVGESGFFVSRILYTKSAKYKSDEIQFAIADGGYSQCQIACGVGQTVRTNLPFSVLQPSGGRRKEGSNITSITGPTCYSQDVMVREAKLDRIEPGDYLVVMNVGAYGKQFSPQEFLQQPEAREYFFGDA